MQDCRRPFTHQRAALICGQSPSRVRGPSDYGPELYHLPRRIRFVDSNTGEEVSGDIPEKFDTALRALMRAAASGTLKADKIFLGKGEHIRYVDNESEGQQIDAAKLRAVQANAITGDQPPLPAHSTASQAPHGPDQTGVARLHREAFERHAQPTGMPMTDNCNDSIDQYVKYCLGYARVNRPVLLDECRAMRSSIPRHFARTPIGGPMLFAIHRVSSAVIDRAQKWARMLKK